MAVSKLIWRSGGTGIATGDDLADDWYQYDFNRPEGAGSVAVDTTVLTAAPDDRAVVSAVLSSDEFLASL